MRYSVMSKAPITIGEARKLLGSKSKALSDDQVQDIISLLSLMAKRYLSKVSSKN